MPKLIGEGVLWTKDLSFGKEKHLFSVSEELGEIEEESSINEQRVKILMKFK